jgi:uncharacterized protein YjbI with pentapeptide repeats
MCDCYIESTNLASVKLLDGVNMLRLVLKGIIMNSISSIAHHALFRCRHVACCHNALAIHSESDNHFDLSFQVPSLCHRNCDHLPNSTLSFENIEVSDSSFDDVDFSDSKMRNITCSSSEFRASSFERVEFFMSQFQVCSLMCLRCGSQPIVIASIVCAAMIITLLQKCVFNSARFQSAAWVDCSLRLCKLSSCDLRSDVFKRCEISTVDWCLGTEEVSNLRGASFIDTATDAAVADSSLVMHYPAAPAAATY